MGKIHDITNPFNKLYAYQFDHNDPEFVERFIHSRTINQEQRASFIAELKSDRLHAPIRLFPEGGRNVIITALKPYRVELFPDNHTWSHELKPALGLIDQLRPKGGRLKLKPIVPAVDHCYFDVTVTRELIY
jgi:hypothetical protein